MRAALPRHHRGRGPTEERGTDQSGASICLGVFALDDERRMLTQATPGFPGSWMKSARGAGCLELGYDAHATAEPRLDLVEGRTLATGTVIWHARRDTGFEDRAA